MLLNKRVKSKIAAKKVQKCFRCYSTLSKWNLAEKRYEIKTMKTLKKCVTLNKSSNSQLEVKGVIFKLSSLFIE